MTAVLAAGQQYDFWWVRGWGGWIDGSMDRWIDGLMYGQDGWMLNSEAESVYLLNYSVCITLTVGDNRLNVMFVFFNIRQFALSGTCV